MRRSALAILLILAIAGPSSAKDVTLADTWVNYIIRTNINAPEPPADTMKVTGIAVGDYAFAMEETPLTTIAEYMGGKLHMTGDAGEAMTWLCYTTDSQALYIYSDGEMGDGRPTAVVVDNRGGAPKSAGCSPYLGDTPVIDFGILMLGGTSKAVQSAYGQVTPDETGSFAYGSITPQPGSDIMVQWQDVYYHETHGVIDAVGVVQETGD